MNLNKKTIDDLKLWSDEFHSIYKYNSAFYTKRQKQDILGNKNEMKCRFCGKTKNETTFKKKAHILPAFMGNLYVKSYYECDRCNSIFGKYENDLASFIGLRRFYIPVGSYKNQRKPVFKLPRGDAEVYPSNRGVEINDLNNEIFEELDDGKVRRCKIDKTPFIPLNVYKSLVKIVLSLLKDETMNSFSKTLNFLLSNDLDCDNMIKIFAKLSVLSISDIYFDYPIIFTYNKLDFLNDFEEKFDIAIPDKTFVIYFKQFCFQIFLPYDLKDEYILSKKEIKLYLYPPILTEPKDISITTLYSKYFHEFRDISGTNKIKNEKDEFYIVNKVDPVLIEYSVDEHYELIKKFNLRRNKNPK